MKWASEYNTGIDVIDEQHKRILGRVKLEVRHKPPN